MWYEFYKFSRDIETIESFLYEVAALEDELAYLGLKYTLNTLNVHVARSAFEDFSANLAVCTKKAPFVNRLLANQLSAMLEETKIESLITQFAVRLKLSETDRPVKKSLATYINIFGEIIFSFKKRKQIFSDESIKLETVLASLSRLKVLLNLLHDESRNININDDEIFKPSNINSEFVATQIDLAVNHLQMSANLPRAEKEQLISYLREAKAELASSSPAWKKIVGALVISATLLSGMADAPQALENLNAAIKHILGTSVQKTLPSLPSRHNELPREPYSDSTG